MEVRVHEYWRVRTLRGGGVQFYAGRVVNIFAASGQDGSRSFAVLLHRFSLLELPALPAINPRFGGELDFPDFPGADTPYGLFASFSLVEPLSVMYSFRSLRVAAVRRVIQRISRTPRRVVPHQVSADLKDIHRERRNFALLHIPFGHSGRVPGPMVAGDSGSEADDAGFDDPEDPDFRP